jgi:hypothetical protein
MRGVIADLEVLRHFLERDPRLGFTWHTVPFADPSARYSQRIMRCGTDLHRLQDAKGPVVGAQWGIAATLVMLNGTLMRSAI